MTIKKITDFVFPVGEKTLGQDAYYRALSNAKSGFYPFGDNGLWHGGIHADDGVLRDVGRNDNKIRCMANGEVIAYRVNNVYPKITYNDHPALKVPLADNLSGVAYFSTGFTLVRHLLVMPKVTGESDAPPSITLYSLYMHQLDYYGYQQKVEAGTITYPHYWHLTHGRVSGTAKDRIKGTTIRRNGKGTEQIALLLKGSKIKLGEQKDKTGWYKVIEVIEGPIITLSGIANDLSLLDGYVYRGDLANPPESGKDADANTQYIIEKEGNDKLGTKESAKTVPGIIVYSAADGKSTLAYLPNEAIFEFGGQENGYAKIKKIAGNYVPTKMVNSSGGSDSPHQGWVKVESLTSLEYAPKALDEVVMLDKPIAITSGDFIGYLGHNLSRQEQFLESKTPSLATEKRPANERLTLQGHFELFTCDDLPAFMDKTKALADKLSESEKSLIVAEQGAQLIRERPSDGTVLSGQYIKVSSASSQSCYVQAKTYYVLTLNRYQCTADNVISPVFLAADNSDVIGISQPIHYRLTAENKADLVRHYQFKYPELTLAAIPDEVEMIGYELLFKHLNNALAYRELNHYRDEVEIRFSLVGDKGYWVRALDVIHLHGGEGQLNAPLLSWKSFPLSLDNLPKADSNNTVHYPRILPLSSIKADNHYAVDEALNEWVYITAGNEEGTPISGWVNVSKGESGDYRQPHIRRASPWEWLGFNPVKETANVANLVEKLRDNHKMMLDLADYTESMVALHHILTKTPLNKKSLPPFTDKQLKEGLRTPWIAEQIGRLQVNYESEWYADESLSKWDEIDTFYQKQTEQKRQSIIDELTAQGITQRPKQERACSILDENAKCRMNEWQIEKQQRIKPSLWWSDVAKVQAATVAATSKAANTTEPATSQPILSNLSLDGKAWHLHPVGMGEFSVKFGITVDMLKQIFTSVPASRQELLKFMADDINAHMEEYKLDTPLRLSHFFAQVRQEVGTSLKIVENFTYSVSRLKSIYSYFRKNPIDAEKYGYPDKYQGTSKAAVSLENQRIIANLAMGNMKRELGNTGSDTNDGWNFRGRGLKQLTGRANYTDFNVGYPTIWSDESVDFVNNPDLLHTNYKYIVRSGVYFWLKNKLYNIADSGSSESNVNDITYKINQHTDSYKARAGNFKRIYHDEKIFNNF